MKVRYGNIINLSYEMNSILVRAKCVRTSVVRALADVVATKLGIILLSFSFHTLFSQKGFAYDF